MKSAIPLLILCSALLSSSAFAQVSITNPGLNGPAAEAIVPPGWLLCANTPDTNDGTIHDTPLDPFEGPTFMTFHPLPNLEESAAAVLLEPLISSTSYSITMQMAVAGLDIPTSPTWVANNQGNNPGIIEIWGSMTGCAMDELLWTSPVILPNTGWSLEAATFTPSANYTHLVFIPRIPPGETSTPYMALDDIFQEAAAVPTLSGPFRIIMPVLLLLTATVALRSRSMSKARCGPRRDP